MDIRSRFSDGDTDPGVSATNVRIGAIVPLSGPLKTAGESIRDTLEHQFAAASRNGGIYGRKIELVAEDSRGTAAGLRDATRRLIGEGNVFALTASLELVDSDESNQLLGTEGIPLIGPIALSPHVRGSPSRDSARTTGPDAVTLLAATESVTLR